MRGLRRLIIVAVLAGCDRIDIGGGKQDDWAKIDESILTTSSGEVQLSDGRRLPYSVTSERYRAWDAAQGALDRTTAERFGDMLDAENPSEVSIQRAVDYLESNPNARESIERSGLSVRDFVMTTVALEQEMRLATGEGRAPRQPPMGDIPLPGQYPVDTFATYQPAPLPAYTPPPTYTPYQPYTPQPYTPITPAPTFDPRDTMTTPRPRVDTVVIPPTPTPTPTPTPVPVQPVQPTPPTPPTPTPAPRDTMRPRTDTQPRPVVPPPTSPSPVSPTPPAPVDTNSAPAPQRRRM